ncbi:MAG: hypothetical protein RMH77_01040 [Sulfolobales archaeon]|nr:hypothetical protein [Sulfolobales archaeon]MCX8186286.1 hypothetical protein [Sulfolobales archaeon]MDW7968978.1 hypothetical protein [Sulfolobales archaeon]
MELLTYRHLTYSEVVEILRKLMESKEFSHMVSRVYEYASKMVKCVDGAKVVEELVKLGLKEITAVMLVNNCPNSVDEILTLLNFEGRTSEQEELNKISEILKSCCTH